MITKCRSAVVTAVCLLLAGGLMVRSQEERDDAGEQERSVTEAEVPAAALATLKQLAGSATITQFAEEIEHGHKFYEGSWKGPNGNVDVLVTEAGDLVEIEEAMPAAKIPASIRAMATRKAGAGTAVRFEKKTMVLYEIHLDKDGKVSEMIFTPDARPYQESAH